jgi:hypothetical protein
MKVHHIDFLDFYGDTGDIGIIGLSYLFLSKYKNTRMAAIVSEQSTKPLRLPSALIDHS